MNQFVVAVSDTFTPYCSPILQCLSRRKRVSVPIGILFLLYSLVRAGKNFCSRRAQRLLLAEKREQIKANIKAFEEKYPQVTSAQQAIVDLDFADLLTQLQDGSLKAVQVLNAFMAKAVEVNKKTNAVTEFLEEAVSRAKGLDALPPHARGPLHGVPISLKEHIMVKGYDCTVGIVSNIGKPAQTDAELVRILKHLGAVPFCRTNLPQTCISFDCSNPIYGITRNYLNPDRSPGGSSGGEGALIAGGGSVMGIGSDVGGSVRIPAAFSGITSLKPTAGRIPLHGQGSDGGLKGLCVTQNSLGLMAKSAKSINECLSKLLSEAVVKKVTIDPRFIPLVWRDHVASEHRTLRIGWYDFDNCFQATPGYQRAIKVASEALRGRGHELVQFTPPNLDQAVEVWGQTCFGDDGVTTMKLLGRGPVDYQALAVVHWIFKTPLWLRRLLSPIVSIKSPMLAGSLLAADPCRLTWQLWENSSKQLELKEKILRAMDDNKIDVMLAPGFGTPALPLGYPAFALPAVSYTAVYNLLNFPAGSVPVTKENEYDQELLKTYPGFETDLVYGWAKEGTQGAVGMPLNVQLIGRPWDEELVLRSMMELEEGLGMAGAKY